MLNTEWNMSKHGFSLIHICTYMDRIWDSVHIWENTDAILIQTEKLRLFCWRLRGGLHYNLPYLLWSYAGSLKLFRERWQHHKLDPKQSVTIFFLQKKTSVVKKLCTLNLINIPRYLNRIYLFIYWKLLLTDLIKYATDRINLLN